MGPLVTTEWLAGELGKPDLVLFDATKYLPNEPKDGKTEFLRAHIPGARYSTKLPTWIRICRIWCRRPGGSPS